MYEYKVVPAPQRAVKVKGLKTTAERFAHTLAEHINAEAAGGWQFVRTESLPCEERSALGSVRLSQQVVMVFARELARPDAGTAPVPVQSTAALGATSQGSTAHGTGAHGAGSTLRLPSAPDRAEPRAEIRAVPRPEPRPELRPELRPEPRPEPRSEATEAAVPPKRRQEPLFRSGAMLRAESGNRAEPKLGPRTGDTGEGES